MNKKILIVAGLLLIIITTVLGFMKQNAGKQEKINDPVLLKIKERGRLVVGSDIPYGVMEFLDEAGNPVGVDVDIAKEIANSLGVELEFKDYDWELLFEAVKNGEVDLAISSITITPERMKDMLFSDPYFNGGQAIIIKAENTSIKLPNDLAGRKVGVQKETTGQAEAQKYIKLELIKSFLSYEDSTLEIGMISALKNGSIEAAILDYIAAVDIIKKQPLLKMAGEPFTQEFYGVATKLGNSALIGKVNEKLKEIKKTGRLDAIKSKWVN